MISLLCDSDIILLDEPTSGMDPHLRQVTCETIREMKKDKVVILTTHYMDEAELLGDRIAIMSQGKLKTCGTPFFLKNRFSDGFLIEVTKADQKRPLDKFESVLNQSLQKISKAFPPKQFSVQQDGRNRFVY
jgi:ABC-type multidrug transport system ATPase subunit